MTEIETLEHILQVASALIAEKGFANVSMNDIVKASGVSKGGIYWHFKSKDEIIIAIVSSIFEQQLQFLDMVRATEGNARDRILTLMNMVADSLKELPDNMPSSLDIYSLASRHPYLATHLAEFFKQYQQHFAELIEQGIAEGLFIVDDTEATAIIFMSTVEGIILVNTMMQAQATLSDTLLSATKLFLKGIEKTEGE
ncbi:MAG: TetR/AcrR family transcriptional regulator [Phototrophicaceae bacterium]